MTLSFGVFFLNQIHRFLYTSISNKTQNWHPIFLIYLLFLTLASDTTSRSSKISFTFKIPHAFAKTNLKPIAKISRRFVYLTRTLSVTLYCAWYKHLCYILICSTSLILKFKKIYFLVLSGILKMNTTLEHNLRTRNYLRTRSITWIFIITTIQNIFNLNHCVQRKENIFLWIVMFN